MTVTGFLTPVPADLLSATTSIVSTILLFMPLPINRRASSHEMRFRIENAGWEMLVL